jgi:hypothetical protein
MVSLAAAKESLQLKNFARHYRKVGCISAEGKFDQLAQGDAFDVIINACNQICSLVSETNSGELRDQIESKLGVSGNHSISPDAGVGKAPDR